MSNLSVHRQGFIRFMCLLALGITSVPLNGQSTVVVNYDFDNDPEIGSTNNISIGQSYMTSADPARRAFFRINKINDPQSSDADGRTGKVGLPTLPENRATRRAYQPEIRETVARIRDFSIDFDHPVAGLIEFDAISAQEQFTVVPYRFIDGGGKVAISLFSTQDFTFTQSVVPGSGTGNRRRLDCRLSLARAANGIFVNLSDGPVDASGGPESFDNFKWSVIPGQVELVRNLANRDQLTIAARLSTTPSIRNSANHAARSPADALPQEYRQVTLKLTARRNLVLFDGRPTATLTFNALNSSSYQTVKITTIGDGNNIVGQGGQEVVDVSIDSSAARHDDFFKDFQQVFTVDIPDDDVPPRTLSVTVDDGSQRSNVTFIKVLFDRQVNFGANAFALRNLATNSQVPLTSQASFVNGGFQVTLSFQGTNVRGPNALVDGNYEFTLSAANIQDVQGLTVSTNQSARFQTLFGDVLNTDGRVGHEDLDVFKNVLLIGGFDARLDFDGDNAITGSDLGQARRNFRP